MTNQADFRALLKAVSRFKLPGQTDSQGLLHWFLFNVFRLDDIESRDALCDGPNDKGIDAVWVDQDSEEIFLFQSVFTDRIANNLGDSELRKFVGSATWFSNPENLRRLQAGQTNPELKALVARFDLEKRLEDGYEVKLVFASTRMLDNNGKEYLESLDSTSWKLDVWDRLRLIGQHKNLERRTRVAGMHTFVTRSKGFDYEPERGVRVHVRPVRASDIASMNGIADRSLFSLNVRSGLGRTRVNRDLERAVRETGIHNQFVLFHNGVTIICKKLQVVRSKIKITDYSVVNGCQSAIAFYENKLRLSDQLQVIARFIEVGDNDALAEDVTYRSNNQNGINLRDLKSNDRIQIALRKQFESRFGGRIEYAIKAGEEQGTGAIIRNDRAGQWIMALYLDEPYNAHQKYRLFGSEYERVFGRDVTAEKIYLSHLAYESVEFSIESVEDPLIRAYQLTKLILLGIIGEMLRKDSIGKELLARPEEFFAGKEDAVKDALQKLAALLVPDFNFYIKERKHAEGFYDYKSAFKSADEYQALSREMQRNYDKAVVKHPEDSFERIFAS